MSRAPRALSLALLSPLVAQGIFFVDIDNTSLAFAVTLFAAIFATAAPPPRRTLALLAGAFLLALWSKLTTPYIVLIAAAVFLILNREPRKLLEVTGVAAAGTAAFLAGYVLYCDSTGYPWRYMFEFTYFGKRTSYLSTEGRSLVQLLHAVWWNIVLVLSGAFCALRADDSRPRAPLRVHPPACAGRFLGHSSRGLLSARMPFGPA